MRFRSFIRPPYIFRSGLLDTPTFMPMRWIALPAPSIMAQSPRLLIVIAYFVSGSFGMFASGIGTAGEELGWRGFLVPELAKVTSFTRLSVISGAIWPAWHIPVIVGADYRGAGPVWYSIVCFVLLVLGASFLFAWMRLKSGRVWTGMLLHASHNLFVQLIFDPLTKPTPLTTP